MTSLAAKFVAKKIFAERFAKGSNEPQVDPFYETVPATRLGMKTTKKRKRALPPGLTPQEEQVLTKAKSRAYRLDLSLFSLCGLRFGWSSVIGLVPAIGDVADMLLAMIVFRTCCAVEPPLSSSTKAKMQMNIIIDFVIGLIPFIGDLADAAYKCNTKNVILLEEELRERGKKRLRQSGQPIPADPSLAEEYDYAQDPDLQGQQPPQYTEAPRRETRRDRRDRQDLEAGVAAPPPARTRSKNNRR